ncbi:hypothetical protein PENTCL1PPCAC_15651, partial [Pristionchus entomophagus]
MSTLAPRDKFSSEVPTPLTDMDSEQPTVLEPPMDTPDTDIPLTVDSSTEESKQSRRSQLKRRDRFSSEAMATPPTPMELTLASLFLLDTNSLPPTPLTPTEPSDIPPTTLLERDLPTRDKFSSEVPTPTDTDSEQPTALKPPMDTPPFTVTDTPLPLLDTDIPPTVDSSTKEKRDLPTSTRAPRDKFSSEVPTPTDTDSEQPTALEPPMDTPPLTVTDTPLPLSDTDIPLTADSST